jgi:glycosyltransferase involved in cell wall biosynthesis
LYHPLVTIGLPFYNASLFLRDAIHSVLNQTYDNWELLLINDGSTDNSLEIAQEFKDIRIKIFSDGENLGLIQRLNQIIALANGSFLARMDSDDIMHIDRITKQVKFLISNPHVDVVGSNYFTIDSQNKILGKILVNGRLKKITDILEKGGLAHPTIIGKTTWFYNNMYDQNCYRFEDLELWLRSVSYSNLVTLNEELLFYRSISTSNYTKFKETNLGIITYINNYRKKYKLSYYFLFKFNLKIRLKLLLYFLFDFFDSTNILVKKRHSLISNDELFQARIQLILSCNNFFNF